MTGMDTLARDPFWNVAERERKEERDLRDAIEARGRELALAQRSLALKDSAGFSDFLKNISALRASVARDLISWTGSDSGMRVLQGKAQALTDILGLLLQSTEAVERLAAEVARLQASLDEVLRRRPAPPETR